MDDIQVPLIAYVVLGVYGACLFGLFLYSLGQLHLVWHYLKATKNIVAPNPKTSDLEKGLPFVTVQLPVFNEKYVIERLLKNR